MPVQYFRQTGMELAREGGDPKKLATLATLATLTAKMAVKDLLESAHRSIVEDIKYG
jgi:hypothetical protein